MDARERRMREFLYWIVAAVVLAYTLFTPTSILLGAGVVVLLRVLFVLHRRRRSEQESEEVGRVQR